mmetsp:Transcript_11471/g.32088  ORF Transcript_11471/g.32088 Transcript_11471/m.32088 type:complete len:200 (+) Transcript_11471:1273-1872(+)
MGDLDICFICHRGDRPTPVESVCQCTWLKVHRSCLSSWQLVNAGSKQESHCRFCDGRLPDWRSAHTGRPMAEPVMSVVFDGQIHQIKVSGGIDGKAAFEADIRRIFRLSADDELSLTFGCRVPGSVEAQELTLEGWGSFDAAVHCAALNAGARGEMVQTPPGKRSSKRRAMGTPSRVLRRLFTSNEDCRADERTNERTN